MEPIDKTPSLDAIMARFPEGWPRLVGCGPGWYPLLLRLDALLSELEPNYLIYQIKEKFGGLRFYFGVPEVEPSCCREFKKEFPCPVSEYAIVLSAEEERALMAWQDRLAEHVESEECLAEQEAVTVELERQLDTLDQMRAIVDDFEMRSMTICEETGRSGHLMTQNGWYRTLAEEFADKGWAPVVAWDDPPLETLD